MKIQFLGATEMVTGSMFYVEIADSKFLVDCGLFQGNAETERMNTEKFKIDPKEVDFIILSHAHIDHSGRIPLLTKSGFRGKIYCTKPTFELSEVMLMDSAFIQENDVEWENRKRKRSGKELIEPLYDSEDARMALNMFDPYLYGQWVMVNDHIRFRFRDAGHILGSAVIELYYKEVSNDYEKTIVFSGDLGTPERPILKDPEFIEEADYLVLESTYGDTVHDPLEYDVKRLIEIINKTASRGGSVIIPSFAVGRTQELIYMLNSHYSKVDDYSMKIPIYIDSPMAVEATKVFQKNSFAFDDEARSLILEGENPFQFENLYYTKTVEESKMLNSSPFPKVIISASGMADAGRVRHHLKHHLWDKRNAVIFVGYQAEGTLGRMLIDGVKNVKILGEQIEVNAKIHDLYGFSAHADQPMIMNWLRQFKKFPKKIFLVHGERDASDALKEVIQEEFKGVNVYIPGYGEKVNIKAEHMSVNKTEAVDPDLLRKDLERQMDEIYQQFGSLVRRSHLIYENDFIDKHYSDAVNELIELQDNLMDLNMMIGK